MVYVTELFSADLEPGKPTDGASGGVGRKVSMFADPKAAKASTPQGPDVRLRGAEGLGMLRGEDPGDGQAQ
jgi:hypothetical protein